MSNSEKSKAACVSSVCSFTFRNRNRNLRTGRRVCYSTTRFIQRNCCGLKRRQQKSLCQLVPWIRSLSFDQQKPSKWDTRWLYYFLKRFFPFFTYATIMSILIQSYNMFIPCSKGKDKGLYVTRFLSSNITSRGIRFWSYPL